jgi:hypothetical protein
MTAASVIFLLMIFLLADPELCRTDLPAIFSGMACQSSSIDLTQRTRMLPVFLTKRLLVLYSTAIDLLPDRREIR